MTAQQRRLEEQKRFEAELARRSKVIDSQGAFLNAIADLLREYPLLLIAARYYHQFPLHRERYLEVRKDYHDKAGDILGRIRAEISKGIRLTTPDMVERLKSLYYTQLLRVDLELTTLIEGDSYGNETNDRK